MAKRKMLLLVAVLALVCSFVVGIGNVRPVSAEYTPIAKGEVRVDISQPYGLQAPASHDRIELPMWLDGTYAAYQLMATEQATKANQESHIWVRVEGFASLEDGWYSMGYLKGLGYTDPWAVIQYGALMTLTFNKALPSANITAVYLKEGLTFMSCYTNSGGPYADYDIGGTIQSNIILTKSIVEDNKIKWTIAQPTELDEISLKKAPSNTIETMGETFDDNGLVLSVKYNSLGNYYEGGENKGALTVEYDPSIYYYSEFVTYEYDFSQSSAVVAKIGNATCPFNVLQSIKLDYNAMTVIDSKVVALCFDHSSKFDAYILAQTEVVTNQFDYCSFYIADVTDVEDGWYTLRELNQKGMVDGITQWGLQLKIFLNPDSVLTSQNVQGICINKGFEFARYTDNCVDGSKLNEYEVAASLTEDYVFDYVLAENGNGDTIRSLALVQPEENDTLEIVEDAKLTYSLQENIDLSGLVLKVTLNSFGGVEYYLPASASYFASVVSAEYDFSETGTTTVTLKYGKAQVEYEVEVVDDIESIEIVEGSVPTSTEITVMPDLSNMQVLVTYKEGNTAVIGINDITWDFEFLIAGDQDLTVEYKGKKATRVIEVVDNNPNSGVNFVKGSSVTVEVAAGVMAIRFSLDGVEFINPVEGPYPLYVVDACSNGLQKIKVQISEEYEGNKVEVGAWYTLEELKSIKDDAGHPYVGGISQLADSLLIHMESYSWQVNEFTPEHVASVKIDKGFYFCDYNRSTWGEGGKTDYVILKNGVLKTDLYLTKNMIGSNWLRVLAEGEDAITVKSLPSKTQYAVDEKFDYTGLVVHVKYADGYEEDIIEFSPTMFKVDMKKTGEQQVRLNIFEKSIYFNINVLEEQIESNDDNTSGGCSSSIGMSGMLALAALGCVVHIFAKKRED